MTHQIRHITLQCG